MYSDKPLPKNKFTTNRSNGVWALEFWKL